ncbi:MAG TPA: class I SAM-dependent methyltransferase [Methylomirabilota bacterium]|nr:class I SAM-dependent methyltransferase [Methylomirabilota bacterium]
MNGRHGQRVREQFGPSAEAYVASVSHAAGADLEQLLTWGRARRPARVLDVATGGGHTALAFAGLATRVVAFDLTEPMLRAAREFIRGRGVGNLAYVAGDVEALPFRPGAFAVVTCRIALHHVANPAAAIREVARVLAPGGSFLVQDILGHDDLEIATFITEVERRRDPSHVRAYRAREWKAFLRGAGLTVIDETVLTKVRLWDDWTGRMRMTPDALRALEGFVRAAPERCRAAFDFKLTDTSVESFTDRMLLLRADRD